MASKWGLSSDEMRQLTAWGYTIRSTWISPMEGWEFRPCIMGAKYALAYRKSPRAAYNFIKRHREGKAKAGAFHAHTQPDVMIPLLKIKP